MDEATKLAQELFDAIARAGEIGTPVFDAFAELVSSEDVFFQEGMEQLSEFFEGEE